MRLASSSGRIRKSPRNHRVVGEFIRNSALRLLPLEFPTFPQAFTKKEKEPKRKKATATVPLVPSKLPIGSRTIRGICSLEFIHSFDTAAIGHSPFQAAETAFRNKITV